MFGIIVLLHNPSTLEVTNWQPYILLQDFLIECRVHGSINYGKSSRSWSNFVSSVHRIFELEDNQDIFGKCETSLCVVFGQQWLLPWKLSHGCCFCPVSFLLLNHEHWPKWGKWGLQFFRCYFGFFYDLLDESSLRSWSNFGRPATPGKVHHCHKFSPFVDNGSDRGSLESKALENGVYNPFQTDTCQLFVSHLFLNFFRSQHDVLLFKHASLCQTGLFKWFLDSNRSGSNQAWVCLVKFNSAF